MSARRALRTRDRRALLVGGLFVGGMLLFARVLPLVAAIEENLVRDRERISRETATARFLARETLDLLDALDSANSTKRPPRLTLETSVLTAPNATAAAALLLTRVSGLAEFAGANVLSASVAGDSAFRGEHAEVSTRMSLALDDVALVRFVSAVEADPAQLAILSIHVVRASPGADGAEARALRAEVLVAAIARRDAESAMEALRVAAQ